MSGDRHDMSDAEWEILRSVLSHKHQGPERVHDRRVMNGIFFVLRTGTPWRDLPERYGPYTTCFNRYNRWSRNGTWAAIMEKLQRLAGDDDGGDDGPPGAVRLRMVDSSSVRVHQHGAGPPRDGAVALLAGLGHDETAGATAAILSRSSRKLPRPLDRETYRTRNLVERSFGKIKEFRRIANQSFESTP